MSRTTPDPLRIDLGLSRWLVLYLSTAHLAAFFLIISLGLETYLSMGLVSLVVLSLIYYWQRDISRSQDKAVTGVDWNEIRGWSLRLNDGSCLQAVLSPSSFISVYMVILHFKTEEARNESLAILRDSCSRDSFRRLRVLLRMHNHFGE